MEDDGSTNNIKAFRNFIRSSFKDFKKPIKQLNKTRQKSENEDRFRTIFDSVNDAILIHDKETGEILDVNQTMCDMFGYSREDSMKLDIGTLSYGKPPYDQTSAVEWIKKAANGQAQLIEWRSKNKDGKLFWTEVNMRLAVIDGKERIIVVVRDINARKEAEAALQESEQRFRLLFENANDAIFMMSSGHFTHCNDLTLKIFGCEKKEDIIGHSPWEFSPKDQPDGVASFDKALKYINDAEHGMPQRFYWKHKKKSGELFDAEVSLNMIELNGKNLVQAIVRDISERMLVLEALKASEQRLKYLTEASFEGIVVTRQRKIIDANDQILNLLGYTKEAVLNKDPAEFIVPEQRENFIKQRVVVDDQAYEYDLLRSDGTPIPVEIRARDLTAQPDSIRIAAVRDLTQRKQAEKSIYESKEQLKRFAARLQNIREEERVSISRELHDNLGQSLTALRMDLFRISKNIGQLEKTNGTEMIGKNIQEMISLVDSNIQLVRKISRDLRPTLLDDLGLLAAIEWQVNDFKQRSGIDCKLATTLDKIEIDKSKSIGIYRIVQEALTNIVRHSKASEVVIKIYSHDGNICLEVNDNGCGITEDQIYNTKTLGLLGMRERAFLIGGELSIQGTLDKGTKLLLTYPQQDVTK